MTRLTLTHRRDTWLGDERWLTGTPLFDWSTITHIVIHWPGHDRVPDGDPGEFADDMPGYIRAMQRLYRDVRGYNVGYSIAVDYLGGAWELRGDTYRNAANAPQALNRRTISITLLVDLDGIVTDLAVDAVRDLVAQIRAVRPGLPIIPHRHGPTVVAGATATACPGDVITARIAAGDFEPRPPTPAPTPPPIEEDDDMCKAYICRTENPYELRMGPGNGAAAVVLRSREFVRFKENWSNGSMPPGRVYHHPLTGEALTPGKWSTIPLLSEEDADTYVGYPDYVRTKADEG